MRRKVPCVMAAALLWLHAGGASALPLGSIRLEVSGIAPGSGSLMVTLHNSAENFKSEAEPVQVKRAPVTGERIFISFDGLTPGYYAITAYQDLNGNGQLDRTADGAPAEPVGYSNSAAGRRGVPEFRATAFRVDRADIPVKIRLIQPDKRR